jgi:uncharacterized protein YcbX
MTAPPQIHSLHVYPVKSCTGFSPEQAELTPTGLAHDREWMVIDPSGRFITQREEPRLALVGASIHDGLLWLSAAGITQITVPLAHEGALREVSVWRSTVPAFDAGAEAAEFFSSWLRRPARLVRFDVRHRRLSSSEFTGEVQAANLFSDGYPILVLSLASLADLNARLEQPLPLNRFRANIVLDGVAAYAEDQCREIFSGDVVLRLVKPCTRCVITTTNQLTGRREGEEPLRVLKSYRYDAGLHGVTFGHNAIILRGVGATLARGRSVTLGASPGTPS